MLSTRIFRFRQRSFTFQHHPVLMGIVNVTPDSFSDGGECFNPADAAQRAAAMLQQGAAFIDVGGESTRPGYTPVTAEEEISRVVPVIRLIRNASNVPISIDTSKASVAAAALEAGADIVNDVTSLANPDMAQVLARYKAGCILMHPGKIDAPEAPGAAIAAVRDWLAEAVNNAVQQSGLPREYFMVDPGIGFGKNLLQNLELMARLEVLQEIPQTPVLLAMSRKSFIRLVCGVEDAHQRVPGTIAASLAARHSAHLLRVHDVAANRQALEIAAALDAAALNPLP